MSAKDSSADVGGWAIYSTAIALLLGSCYYLMKKRRKKADPRHDNQLPWPQIPKQKPGNGAPIFHGVRVVELSTIIAAPSTGRMLSDLGAEVIKVEGPGGAGKGEDPFRAQLLPFASSQRKARGVSIFFDPLNCGKRSVCIDIRRNRDELIAMLRDADVMLTNMLPQQLSSLGLDYADLKEELPGLIVAQINAWGREGPDHKLPGFDISAFWAATGFAHQVHSPNKFMYSCYPTGFGDCCAGVGLLGGIATALSKKLATGRGCLVTNSLYGTGLFCNAPVLLRHKRAAVASTRLLEHGVQDYDLGKQSETPLA